MKINNKDIRNANYIPTWEILPSAIRCITMQRNHLNDKKKLSQKNELKQTICGLNYSIILNSACLIEGILDNFLKVTTKIKFLSIEKSRSKFEEKLFEDFINRISISTWSKYNSIFEIVMNKKLSDFFNEANKALWKDVEFLFKFRNLLAHGESIEMNYGDQSPEVVYHEKADVIEQFLKSRDLADKQLEEGDLFLEYFLTDKIADYFFEKTKEFIFELSDNIQMEQNPILNKERILKAFYFENTEE
jgi:hypothetical protein